MINDIAVFNGGYVPLVMLLLLHIL